MYSVYKAITVGLFGIIMLQLLGMFTYVDVRTFHNNGGINEIIAMALGLDLIFACRLSPTLTSSRAEIIRSFCSALLLASLIVAFPAFIAGILLLAGKHIDTEASGYVILGLFALDAFVLINFFLIFIFGLFQSVAVFTRGGLQGTLGRRIWAFPVVLLIMLSGLVVLEQFHLKFCSHYYCRYSIAHRNPEVCHQYAPVSCFIETAMYNKDEAFCGNIRPEDALRSDREGAILDPEPDTEIRRCTEWVQYAKSHAVSFTDDERYPHPWRTEFPPTGNQELL